MEEKNVNLEKKFDDILLKKNAKLENRTRLQSLVLMVAGIVITILFFRTCSGEKENANLKADIITLNDSIDLLNKNLTDCNNRKAVNIVRDTIGGKLATAMIVDGSDNRLSTVFLKKEIKYYPVQILVPCPSVEVVECPDVNQGLVNKIDSMDNLLNSKVNICMEKEYRNDSTALMFNQSILLKSFLQGNPRIDYSNTYAEYALNPYRLKTNKSFKRGVCLGAVSILAYASSEALGNPVFIDGQDNRKAKEKSNQIKALRIGSGIFAAASIFEFGRTIYFHNMEGKFIINPTKIGLTLYLDNPVQKIKK